jgi:asparagine synthase (glutamine-hydrolysing)
MCGIAGVVSWRRRFAPDRTILERMSACLAHRGPDGEGIHLDAEHEIDAGRPAVGLVHRRLAVIDPNPRANQPFEDGTGRWVVFNGEIYNFQSLREELGASLPEHRWRTQSDTEVLLAAYGLWGERCVERFNGMFAFAIWDHPRQTLFMARDRMGQKPLYWAVAENGTDGPGAVAFASELKALRQVPWVDQTISQGGLSDYLCWGFVPAPGTIYRNIEKLPPSGTLSVTGRGLVRGTFSIPSHVEASTDPVEQTRRIIHQAVRRQLVSDVPLGCFLSGGIDSSIIAAAMKQAVGDGQSILTFSIGFDDPRYDETAHAAAVARHLGTKHQRFVVQPRAAEDLPKLARAFGEPFADSSALPVHDLSRETRKHVTVALSGDGGDELFGGYDRYRAMLMGQALAGLPSVVRTLAAGRIWQRLPGWHPKSRWTRFKRFLAGIDQRPEERYATYMRLFDGTTLRRLLSPAWQSGLETSERWMGELYERFNRDGDATRSAMRADQAGYLPGDLFAKVDACSMQHALEVRCPFMDPDVVNWANQQPTEALANHRRGKLILRRAFAADLPAEVFQRRKMGFAVPIGEWFRTSLRPMLEDHLFDGRSFASSHFQLPAIRQMVQEHLERRLDHSQRLYALLMLELWHRDQSDLT